MTQSPRLLAPFSRRAFCIGAAAAAVAPAGCAHGPYTEVTEIWRTKEPITVSRLLIMGISEDSSRRLRFEGRTAQAFQNAGVYSKSAEELLGNVYPYARPALLTITEQNDLDGAMVVRLISYDHSARVDITGPGMGEQPKATWENQLKHAYDPEWVEPAKVARAETALYQVSTEKLVWSGLSETFAPENADEAIASYGAAITKKLLKSGLVSKIER